MVRVYSAGPQASRLAWYDRNAVLKADFANYAGGPHAETIRVQYVCPSGRKAMVEVLQAILIRLTAPTTGGVAMSRWDITPSGGATKRMLITILTEIFIAAKDMMTAAISPSCMLFPGDYIQGITVDGSTGGTCFYSFQYKLTEFDA